MIRSVARHCEPPHNWTLPCGDEPHFLNGPVSSRIISTAVFHKRTLIPEDTESHASDSLQSAWGSAERRQMFEATRSPLTATATSQDGRHHDFSLEIKQPPSELFQLATRKQGSRSSTIAGKTPLEEKTAKLHRATGTYCLTFKDIQMLGRWVGVTDHIRTTVSPSSVC